MNRGLLLVSAIAAFACAASGRAADSDVHCTARTQLANDLCSAERYRAANVELGRVYEQLVAKLKKDDEPNRVIILEAGQKAWEEFRDVECQFVESAFEGGSMAPMVESDCLAHLTQVRAQKIVSYIHCDAEKDYLCEKPGILRSER